MIIEHEVIEQIERNPTGRSFSWLCDYLATLGQNDPSSVLFGMWHGGHIVFVDQNGDQLPTWQCEQFVRSQHAPDHVSIKPTNVGLKWVYGS
jgi:hypothetical protein